MSSPILVPHLPSGLYVPIHRRTPSSASSSPWSPASSLPSRSPSPTLPASAPTLMPTPALTSVPGVYSPAELLLLATSPLATLSAGRVDALRALAPEVVLTRKQRKAREWHIRHPTRSHSHTRSHTSESEEDRVTSWRRS